MPTFDGIKGPNYMAHGVQANANTFTANQTIGTSTYGLNGLISNTAPAATTLSTVACAANVVTAVTTTAHSYVVGQGIVVNAADNTYDATVHIASVPSAMSFTYALTHGNEAAKADAGSVTPYAQVRIGAAPTTPDASADLVIGGTASTSSGVTIQMPASHDGSVLEIQRSTGQTVGGFQNGAAYNYWNIPGEGADGGLCFGYNASGQTFDGIQMYGDEWIGWSSKWNASYGDAAFTHNDLSVRHAKLPDNTMVAETLSIDAGRYWGSYTDCLRLTAGGRIYGNAVDASTISAATWAGGVATITCTGDTRLAVGQVVTIDCDVNGFDGTFRVASMTAPSYPDLRITFTYALAGDPGSSGTSGSVTPVSQITLGGLGVTAKPDADVFIGATGTGQVPLAVQGAASQADNLQEWQASTGSAVAAVGKTGTLIGTNGVRVGTVEHFAQASAPATRNDGSALTTGDTWTETDTGMRWYYDSTVDSGTWLSEQMFDRGYTVGGSTSGEFRFTPRLAAASYDVYVVDISLNALVVGSTGADGWTHYIQRTNQANNSTTDIASLKTWAPAAGGNKRAITSNVATITIAAGHDFLVGERVTVANATAGGEKVRYEITAAITAAAATTISYAVSAGADEAEQTDATITVCNEDSKWCQHWKAVGTLLDVSALDMKTLNVTGARAVGSSLYGGGTVRFRLAVPK